MIDPSVWGTLFIVATPIGNLEDITLRAIRILKEVDLVAAEDTRHSRKLFNHYAIDTPLTSCFEHNEAQKGEYLMGLLMQGQSVALISDAGTPAISDPGALLVQRCRDAGIRVSPVPGPSACIAALSMAGLPTQQFCFDGFLPPKSGSRRRILEQYLQQTRTVVLYEAPHRLLNTLRDIIAVLGESRHLAIARELTKLHEELFRGSAVAALDHFSQNRVRGEIVLLLAPPQQEVLEETVEQSLLRLQEETDLPQKVIIKQVAKMHGISGSEVYKESLRLKGK
ncbi:MAG: 16S rRNA (cytidine(1402)-2'-O)-methyltransferase [Desulfobacteraceae bacterium 4572_35.1]|nr:MAG: 16S rRNA (cytidine(1402)-2'-O)-methyltransferase [Desulfobacteraceae bacterium 4572_35.1]